MASTSNGLGYVNTMINESILTKDNLDLSGKILDKFFAADDSFPTLIEKMQITKSSQSVSGCSEYDYPKERFGIPSITLFKSRQKIPLSGALLEQWNDAQHFNRKLGIFPEINRVWVTIDQKFFLWDYSEGTDLSCFDGMNSTIFAVALVQPKPNVFQPHIKHLLVLVTRLNIAILGVTFKKVTSIDGKNTEQLELTTDVLYEVPTDGVITSKIIGTNNGRIFLASEDGDLFEIDYWYFVKTQNNSGWFSIRKGKRCKKICHSAGTLTNILPSFLTHAITNTSAIIEIAVDNTRHILYTLTENSSIELYDLGSDGKSIRRIVSLSHSDLEYQVSKLLGTTELAQMTLLSSIKIIEEIESPSIHLMVVSKSGFRLYFSTGAITSSNTRPSSLKLVHIRFPPGYKVIGECKPSSVQHVLYNRGTIIMACNTDIINNRPMLWCISPDEYAFNSHFSERYFITDLNICPLSLSSIGPNLLINNDPSSTQPPLIVRQQFENRQEYITLAPEGLEIFEMLRPYDTLCELLVNSQGLETDAIKTYFKNVTDDQACVTCLTIICDQSLKNIKIKEYATHAFFAYGGEPKLVTNKLHELTRVSQNNSFRSSNFTSLMSMPTFIKNQTNTTYLPFESTSVQYSSKHNALYIFVSRLLRPLWNIKAVNMKTTNGKTYIVNTVSPGDCLFVANHLQTLHSFIKNYSKMLANYTKTPLDTSTRTTIQDAHQTELKSIECLELLVVHSAEVFNLWKLLSEHEFYTIANKLFDQEQRVLENVTFKELILVYQELSQTLAQKLLDTYLSRSPSIESISKKLRQVCPSIYYSGYTTSDKASELIKLAQYTVNEDERKQILYNSLMILKKLAPDVNLKPICLQYTNCAYMEGVYQLCREYAKKIDPKNLSGHYYVKSMVLDSDRPGYSAYTLRLSIYQEISKSLDYLYSIMVKNPSLTIPTRPNLKPITLKNSAPTSKHSSILISELIKLSISCDDEIMHIIVYKWMLDKKLTREIIIMGHNSLEKFLLAQIRSGNNNNYMKYVLYRYYEYKEKYLEAAEVLVSVAKRRGNGIPLSHRIEYLSQAVTLLRSNKLRIPLTSCITLRDIKELLQVAEIQKMILDLLLASQVDKKADIIDKLNSCLFLLSELYSDFAKPHSLWEAQLAILQISKHYGLEQVKLAWENILLKIVEDYKDIDGHNKMTIILEKIKSLAISHPINSFTFNLEYLTTMLEYWNCKLGGDLDSVYSTMLTIGAPVESLVTIYKNIFSTNYPHWQKTNELHVLNVIMSFARYCLQSVDLWSSRKGINISGSLLDLLEICVTVLDIRFSHSPLIEGVAAIKNELENHIDNNPNF